MKQTLPIIPISEPFHLFEYQGCAFAYHYALGDFIAISPAAKDVLQHICEGRQTIEEIQDATLKEEFTKLETAGFFRPYAVPVHDEKEVERLLERRYDAP